MLESLGRESGLYSVEFARTGEELLARTTADALGRYAGVVFASSTGPIPLADRERFLAWIAEGHAFIGLHAASTTFMGYRPFAHMLGGEFDYHREQVRVEPTVEDKKHPATRHLRVGFSVFDEVYVMKSFERQRVHPLLSLDRHPNTGEPGYFPLAWTREEGKGRVFYTAFGHRDDVIEAEWYRKHVLGGIRWALRAEGASSSRTDEGR
jgi:hypothetical protein